MNLQAPQADDLLPISLATLPLTATVGVNVYLLTRPSEPPLLFSAAHIPISREQFEDLMHRGSSKLYIHREDRNLYRQAVQERWESLLEDQSLPTPQRLATVFDMARDSIIEQAAWGDTDGMIRTCQHYGSSCVAALGENPLELSELNRILTRDCSYASHAVNVCAYTILLGRSLGFSRSELEQQATAAMLHDLGMLDIDEAIWTKPDRLEDGERRQINTHPALGLQRLISRSDLSEGALMMIYQHHERWNGTGYPVAVSGDEIHPWSRMCSIVDVYDAMTSQRPHRRAFVPQTALAVLDRGAGTLFDQEMVSCWRHLALK